MFPLGVLWPHLSETLMSTARKSWRWTLAGSGPHGWTKGCTVARMKPCWYRSCSWDGSSLTEDRHSVDVPSARGHTHTHTRVRTAHTGLHTLRWVDFLGDWTLTNNAILFSYLRIYIIYLWFIVKIFKHMNNNLWLFCVEKVLFILYIYFIIFSYMKTA